MGWPISGIVVGVLYNGVDSYPGVNNNSELQSWPWES